MMALEFAELKQKQVERLVGIMSECRKGGGMEGVGFCVEGRSVPRLVCHT